jgi:hypothetical protein
VEEYLTDVGLRFTLEKTPDELEQLIDPKAEEPLLLFGKLPVDVASDLMKSHDLNQGEIFDFENFVLLLPRSTKRRPTATAA